MYNLQDIVLLGLTISTAALIIAPTAGIGWRKGGQSGITVYSGLYEYCVDSELYSECHVIPGKSKSDKLIAAGAFMIIASVTSSLTLFAFLLAKCRESRPFLKVVSLLFLFTTIYGAIALACFTAEVDAAVIKVGEYGWSYKTGWAGVALAFLSCLYNLLCYSFIESKAVH